MTGELIRFDRHFSGGDHHRQQPVSHGTAHGVRHSSVVDLQVARIARLLTELEELTPVSESAPAALLEEVRADLAKARRVITPWTAAEPRQASGDEGDPQPLVDDERLEWMYRELNRDA